MYLCKETALLLDISSKENAKATKQITNINH